MEISQLHAAMEYLADTGPAQQGGHGMGKLALASAGTAPQQQGAACVKGCPGRQQVFFFKQMFEVASTDNTFIIFQVFCQVFVADFQGHLLRFLLLFIINI